MASDNFVLKEQRKDINEIIKETLRRQHKTLLKRKRGKDKDDQESGKTFMTTTTDAVQEVCMVKGDIARERVEVEDKSKRENIQAESDRANKKRNRND